MSEDSSTELSSSAMDMERDRQTEREESLIRRESAERDFECVEEEEDEDEEEEEKAFA